MKGYSIVSLKDIVDEIGEGETKRLIASFCCPLNKDVEYYLHHTAIEFAKQSIAPTFWY